MPDLGEDQQELDRIKKFTIEFTLEAISKVANEASQDNIISLLEDKKEEAYEINDRDKLDSVVEKLKQDIPEFVNNIQEELEKARTEAIKQAKQEAKKKGGGQLKIDQKELINSFKNGKIEQLDGKIENLEKIGLKSVSEELSSYDKIQKEEKIWKTVEPSEKSKEKELEATDINVIRQPVEGNYWTYKNKQSQEKNDNVSIGSARNNNKENQKELPDIEIKYDAREITALFLEQALESVIEVNKKRADNKESMFYDIGNLNGTTDDLLKKLNEEKKNTDDLVNKLDEKMRGKETKDGRAKNVLETITENQREFIENLNKELYDSVVNNTKGNLDKNNITEKIDDFKKNHKLNNAIKYLRQEEVNTKEKDTIWKSAANKIRPYSTKIAEILEERHEKVNKRRSKKSATKTANEIRKKLGIKKSNFKASPRTGNNVTKGRDSGASHAM